MPVDDDNTLLLAPAVVEGIVHSNHLQDIVVVVGSDAVEDSHVDYRHRPRHVDYPRRQQLPLHSPPTRTPQVKFHFPTPPPLLLNYDPVLALNV